MNNIDFSSKHHILLRHPDGTLLPMDEPYFESRQIAEGTWQIRSDGDSSYLVAGDNEAIVIDSGYGAGNIREYCQTLTDKPVKNIVNTHDHFDHTANNSYFEKAYMTQASSELATIPFPSFEGIDFPRDYPIEIVKDGDVIDLGGRTLTVIETPDHAVGSIMLLDSREGILFAGDELGGNFKKINGNVHEVLKQFEKLEAVRDRIHEIWGGSAESCEPEVLDKYLESFRYIIAGGETEEGPGFPKFGPRKEEPADENVIIYDRFRARPCDMKLKNELDGNLRHTKKFGVLVIFDADNI